MDVGRWIIFEDKSLGSGSYSTVYLGIVDRSMDENPNGLPKVKVRLLKDTPLAVNDETVAIKRIDVKNMDKRLMVYLNEEIDIMLMIRDNPHPNIIKCHNVVRTEDYIYIIMEYCDSGDLSKLIKKPIKEKYAQYYFSQLASGMKYLNDCGIVHRDIKPKNILLKDNRKILKIADFGFAKQSNHYSLYDTMCGSPMYMSPEVINKHTYNDQTDLWAIGMILYEMLYSHHPFQNCKNINELRRRTRQEQVTVPPKHTSNKDVSVECLELLRRLLENEVDKRISWQEFFTYNWIIKYQLTIQDSISEPEVETVSRKDELEGIDEGDEDGFSSYEQCDGTESTTGILNSSTCMFELEMDESSDYVNVSQKSK